MELTQEQKTRITLGNIDYIRADAKLALAHKDVELAKANVELAHSKMSSIVDTVARELGLDKPENKGRYHLDVDKLAIEDKRPAKE